MEMYTENTEVEFYASRGYAGSDREHLTTLKRLGLTSDSLKSMTNEDVKKFLGRRHKEWMLIVFGDDNIAIKDWEIKG